MSATQKQINYKLNELQADLVELRNRAESIPEEIRFVQNKLVAVHKEWTKAWEVEKARIEFAHRVWQYWEQACPILEFLDKEANGPIRRLEIDIERGILFHLEHFLHRTKPRLKSDAISELQLVMKLYKSKCDELAGLWQSAGDDVRAWFSNSNHPDYVREYSMHNVSGNHSRQIIHSEVCALVKDSGYETRCAEKEYRELEAKKAELDAEFESGERQLAVSNIERKIQNLIDRLNKNERNEAKAAAYDENIRKNAEAVIRSLVRTELCPYCDNPLGESPHADHIFPVDFGGLSIQPNMVFVCSNCNLRKSNLTLRAFCAKMGFDRDIVEVRLIRLGKTI